MAQHDRMESFSRTIALLGLPAFERLQAARVAVLGVGGVGAACAEALVRGGVGQVALVDHDSVSPSNLNRQLIALHSTLGQLKTAACKRRLLDIAPEAQVDEYPLFYEESTALALPLDGFDAVADCMDTLASKLLLARRALDANTYLISCMGAGNRLDPTRFQVADIYQTSGCPLARRMRKACREAGIPALRVLYSTEAPLRGVTAQAHGRHVPGTVSFVPPVAGMMMAGDIIRYLMGTHHPPANH